MARAGRWRRRRNAIGVALGSGMLVAALGIGWLCSTQALPRAPAPPAATSAPTFVGEAVCASCHAREAAAWQGSDHQRAMQPANDSTVLGNFANATLRHSGITSTMFRRGDTYVVRTDGPDGALHDYEVAYTFGVAPLQQYLVALPNGRLQALQVAWDSRPAAQGGQRWFHLYPDETIDHTDSLHWTGATANWNYMCADCHSTNVRKAWSERDSSYATTFAALSVSCEACHGPGSQHVADPRTHLGIALDERAGVFWTRDAVSNKPVRSRPRTSEREIEMCARCHSRRGLVHEDVVHGQSVGDDYRVALLDDELYYPDGQIKGEVYEYGSFVQSRMFAAGVTCSDCHDPHSGRLRVPGDGVCLQCHAADTYSSEQHHRHPPHSDGARCVSCHMTATTYMVVDSRRDHSLRVPRPDLSVKLGVPNACNGCHADRTAAWAAKTVETWYGHTPSGLQQFAEALAAGSQRAPDATRLLEAVIADRGQPAIARASALVRLDPLTPAAFELVRDALADASFLVRRAAVEVLARTEPQARADLVAPLLADPVRVVRLEAAQALAGVPLDLIPASHRDALARATAALVAAHELNSDRPEAHLALATLHASGQDYGRAEAELRRALALDPTFVPAVVNLADLYRVIGRDDAAEPVLRAALIRTPGLPALEHALGLVLVRQRRMPEAIEALGAAARLGGDEPRYGYVYAVALHDVGRTEEALRVLEQVLRRHPGDRDSLAALAAFSREK